MYISYEELKEMEEKYLEALKSAEAHLDVVRELLKLAEAKAPVEEDCDSTEATTEFEQTYTIE